MSKAERLNHLLEQEVNVQAWHDKGPVLWTNVLILFTGQLGTNFVTLLDAPVSFPGEVVASLPAESQRVPFHGEVLRSAVQFSLPRKELQLGVDRSAR